MYNALLINWLDIEKIEVDFSDFNSVYHALGANRVSTIHTYKTQELSRKLGIHLVGFVDREGDDINNEKACEISGYDYLGSKMLLCKTDDQFNALPFTDKELKKVYIYLTEGKIVNSFEPEDKLGDFFEKYNINPYLPSLLVKPEAILFDKYPNVILIKYNFSNVDTSMLVKIGEALFPYSEVMLNEFVDVGNDVKKSKSNKYYLKNKGDIARGYYCIIIQAIIDEDEKPVIQDIDSFINGNQDLKTKTDGGKTSRGSDKKDDDSFMDEAEELYVVEFEVDVSWPDNPLTPRTHYRYCYPLSELEEKDQPFFLYFEDFFTIESFNDIKEEVGIKVKMGDKEVELILPLEKTVTLPLDYYASEKNTSHRVGQACFTLRRGDFSLRMNRGRFLFKTEYLNLTTHTVESEEIKYLDPTNTNKDERYVELGDGTVVGLYMVDVKNKYFVFYCSGDDPDSDDEIIGFFVSVRGNEENVYEDESTEADTGDRTLLRITYKYEE